MNQMHISIVNPDVNALQAWYISTPPQAHLFPIFPPGPIHAVVLFTTRFPLINSKTRMNHV